ncbi:MAG: hypothetical protein RR360_01090 [Raoultibacter sp.]
MSSAETNETPIDLEAFKLSAYDRVRIEMPAPLLVSKEDIDSQLFPYIATAPKGSSLHGLEDLDDAWVAENFPEINGIEGLRDLIAARIKKDNEFSYENLKFAQCADALIDRLEGEISEEAIAANLDEVRKRSEAMIGSFGLAKKQYLKEEGITEVEYEEKLKEETKHDLALNIALDKMIEMTATTVSNSELTDFLSTDNPDAFLRELQASGKVEEARHAASRVKVMRRIVETAEITVAE